MPSVDNRTVEMRFDNRDFEGGVTQSLGTIEKLKKSLKFKDAAEGFRELERASQSVGFSKLVDASGVVMKKFSALGTIGDQVLRRIGDQVYGLTTKMGDLAKSMSVDQITKGYDKYEQKTASVQTIINATGKDIKTVNKYLDRLMWYSDETSFGFTDMTAALQTMTSSGGDLDKLIPMLMGIGNATAFAGKGAGEFSRVMYNLNQAYSMGFLGTGDWRSIELAGASSKQLKETLLEVTKELGKGEYTMETFSEALTDKVFDKEVLEEAFGRFAKVTLEAEKLVKQGVFDTASDAYDYLSEFYTGVSMDAATAAQEAKTFTEAIEATKDAVSSGWMTSFEYIFGDYVEAKRLWTWLSNELWDLFASGAEGRNEMLKQWHDGLKLTGNLAKDLHSDFATWDGFTFDVDGATKGLTGYEMFIESLQNLWEGFEGIVERGKEIFAEIIPPMTYERLMNITEGFHSFSEKFRDAFAYVTDVVEDTGIASVVETAEEAIDTLHDLDWWVEQTILGKYGNEPDRFKRLLELGVNPELIQNAVNERLGSDYYNELIHGTSLYLNDLADAQDDVAMGYRKAEAAMSDNVPTQKKLVSNTEALFSILRGVAHVISVVRQSAVALWHVAVDRIFPAIGRAINPILNYLGNIGEQLVDWARGITIESIEDKINSAVDWLASVKDSLASIISQARELPSVQRLLERWGRFKNWIGGIKDSAWEAFTGFFSSDTFKGFLPTEEKVLNWIDQLSVKLDQFAALIESWNIPEKVKSWWGTIRDFFSGVFNYVGKFKGMSFEEITTTLWTDIQSLWQGFEEFINSIDFSETFAKLEEYARTVGDFFASIWEIIFGSWGGTEETGAGGHTPDRKMSAVNTRRLNRVAPTSRLGEFVDIETPEPTVIDKLKEFLSKVAETIKEFLSTVSLQDIHTFGKALLELLVLWRTANMFKSIGGAFDKIGSFFGALNSRVKPKVTQIKIPWLLQMAILIGVIVGSLKLLATIPWKTLQRVAIVLGALLGVVMLMGIVFSLLGRFVLNSKKGAVGIDKMGAGMLMLGLTVLALAGALKLLSTIKEEELKGMWGKIVMLGVIFGAITVASMLLGKFGGAGIKQGFAMLMFAGSMVLLVTAMEKLAKADLSGLKERMPQILEAIVFLGLISWATKSASLSSGLGVTILILDILLLEWVLEKLAKVNTGDMFRGILNFGIIAVLMGVLAGIMRIAGKNVTKINKVKDTTNIEKSRSNMLQFAISMLIIAGTMLVMAEAIEKIGSIPADAYRQGIAGVAGILAFFTALEGLSFATKNSKMIGFGVGMILTAVAVYGLGLAIQKIGTIPSEDFEQGYKAVMAIMGVMTAMMGVSRLGRIDVKNFLPILFVLAGVFVGAYLVLKNLADIFGGSAEYAEAVSHGLAEVISSLTGIFGIMAFFNRTRLKTVKEGKKDIKEFKANWSSFGAAVLSIIIILGAIFAAMLGLNWIFQGDTASFTAFATGLSALITAMTPLFAIMALLTRPKIVKTGKDFAKINIATLFQPLVSMAALIAGIIAVGGLAYNFTWFNQWMTSLASLLGTMAGSFVTAFTEFTSVHIDGSGLVTFANNLKTAIDTVASIFDNFDETTAGFTEFFGDETEGSPLSNMMEALDNLVSFGLKLVEFRIVKGLMGKNLGGLSEFMQEIADSDIGTRFNDLASAVKDLTPEEIQKVNDMTGVLGALVQVQSDMVGFSDEWTSYTDTYTEAYDSVNGGLDKITQKKTGKKSLATRTLGIGDFVQLAEGLSAIADSVGQVMDMIKEKVPDGDFSALISMTEALGALVEVQKKMVGFSNDYSSYVHELETSADGTTTKEVTKGFTSIADFIMGIGDLDEFSAQLPEVAQMFAKMVEEVDKANLTPKSIEPINTMAEALGALADVQTHLVGQNGEFSVDQFLHGFGNLADFANELAGYMDITETSVSSIYGTTTTTSQITKHKSLGESLKQFITDLSGLPDDAIETAQTAADISGKIASIYDYLGGLEGAVQFFVTGKQDLGDFGESLSTFGVNLVAFSNTIGGENRLDLDAFRDAGAATTILKTMASGDEVTWTDTAALNALGDSMLIVAQNINEFGGAITKFGVSTFEDGASAFSLLVNAFAQVQGLEQAQAWDSTNLTKGIWNFADAMEQLGYTSFNGFMDVFNSEDVSGDAKSQGNILVQYISTGITENLPLITEAGKSIVTTLGSAIGTFKVLVTTATRNMINAMLNKFTGLETKFYNYGMYAMQGLANGISGNAYLAIREANKAALDVANATANVLQVQSPSKVFERIGMYIDQGLANGIRLHAYEAENASGEMAESTLSGFQTIVSQIMNAINNEWDDDMTIRPVLDLSEIQNGAARIGSLFGNGYTYTPSVAYARNAMANAGAAREEASAAQQYRSTVLVDEIRSMRQDIANLEYDMRNMQVVMQGGALVGQIGPKMSQWLDRNETLKNRGV